MRTSILFMLALFITSCTIPISLPTITPSSASTSVQPKATLVNPPATKAQASLPSSQVPKSSQAPLPPNGEGPYFHQISSATSSDGLTWTHDNKTLIEHASVPAAIVIPDGKVRLYYVDASQVGPNQPENVNCAESADGGATFKVLNCKIANRSGAKAVDPSIVRLSDGRYRLYYYAATGNTDTKDKHSIYSAISTDGIQFTQEQQVFEYPGLVDPDVFWTGKEWLMYVFSITDGTTVVAKSSDGLNFTYVGASTLKNWGTTAPYRLDDGRLRLYTFNQPNAQQVASFVSTDGINWMQDPGIRLTAPEGKQLTDPFVVRLSDGTWKMFFKVSTNKTNPLPNAQGTPPRPPLPGTLPAKTNATVTTHSVINPTTNAKLNVTVYSPQDTSKKYPALVLVPGGIGDSNGLLDEATQISNAGMVAVTFDAEGRGKSTGQEDYNGFKHQDGLAAVIRFAATLSQVDANKIGLATFSYGITMGSGVLARYPDLPIKFLIDWEGPANRSYTSGCNANSGSNRIQWQPCTDNAWWSEREAVNFIGKLRVPYQRIQSEKDHVQSNNNHAIDMINAASKGSVPYVRLNNLTPNQTYDTKNPPQMMPDTIDRQIPQLVIQYAQELFRR